MRRSSRRPRFLARGLAPLALGIAAGSALPAEPPAAPPPSGFEVLRTGVGPREIDLARVAKGIPRPDPRDGIPTILAPTVVAAGAADHVRDGDPVIGLVVGDEARAYPVRILDRHEVANDVLGGVPVAVTYCPLCDSAVAVRRDADYDPARRDEPPLTFGVSGYLYESDVLLYDHQTETFWTQIAARGALGPLTGKDLARLPLRRTFWKAWRGAHPTTTVLSWRTEHGWPRAAYVEDVYAEYRLSKQLRFPVRGLDARLPKKTVVHGLAVGGEATAIPADAVVGRTAPIALTLGGREVRASVEPSTAALVASVRESAEGERWVELPVLRAYWFAWAAFHPTTSVWEAPR